MRIEHIGTGDQLQHIAVPQHVVNRVSVPASPDNPTCQATVVRTLKSAKASLNLAADLDPSPWETSRC
jgi:hypothetical protein